LTDGGKMNPVIDADGHVFETNYVYSVAEPDGTTLGSMFPSLYFAQLTGEKKSGLIGRNSLGLVLPNIMAVFFYMRRNKIWRRSEVRCNAGPWP
jgi:hypothetical protein